MVSRYVTNGPVKQEGLCIMPPPPTHYRMMPPQRADAAFHVAQQQPYVQPPPNQTGNQGPTIRAMAQTGPPTQASTPPNSDLKVSQMSQSMNLAFVQPVRGTTQSFFGRPPPQSQPPRMPNHRIQGQQPVFPPQSTPFIQPMAQVQPIYCMSYYGTGSGQRPMVPQYYPGQTFATISYPQTPQQTQTYINYQQFLPRGHQQQVVASAPQNLQQVPPPPIALAQTTQQQQQGQGQKKRRAKAIPIIDPESGKDKLDEIYVNYDCNPPSGESSARQTPQPQYIPNKEVQNTFNKQVNMVINQEKMDEVEHSSSPSLDQHIDTQPVYQLPPTQAVHISNRNDLVHTSKLQLPTKEFVPAGQHTNTAKEVTPTPVVSANVVTAEVTINKQNRESPVKSRKQREPQLTKETKEPPVVLEKKEELKINKEEFKIKEPTSPPVSSVMLTTKEVKEASNQREEKKTQKKDKVEQQRPLAPSPEIVTENISQQNSLSVPVQENGKSKQRNKDVQKQQAPSPPQMAPVNNKTQQNTPIPVPQSQPAKANNKTNKMKELNMKGANKEGTDMDAFNDNTLPIDTVVVTNTNTTINDMINANDILNNVNDSNKKIDSNEISTIKSENKTLPKKVDVTDIVKDVPKPFVAPVEPCDETDRVEYDNDKIVQVKNEVNTKANIENESNVTELRPTLPYKEDQWSPSNTSGKKEYDRDFLLALRNDPKSRKKPDNLLDMIAQEDRGRIGDISRYPMGGKPTDFIPNFSGSNYSAKSMPTRSTLPNKRNSQQGKSSGNAKGAKSGNVIRSLSVRGDVKLNESENAWKPARFTSSANMSDDDKKTQELYKKVRGVLNKLTPQKFDTLLIQVRTLTIDTKERLQGVIDLVFEKAVDEPNFSVAYSNMCKELALMQVPSSKKEGEFVNFRKLLVTRCQLEFEKNSIDETARNVKVKEIEECTDPEKKKELQVLLEEDDRRIRIKSVGNIRFIGELFKQQMLTVNIMVRCLNHLLDNKEEESLECLCKLLSTVGKEVEEKKVDLNPIFTIIREIVDKKHGKISSRVRFMLQDVIDLRNSKWIPRRQDINPKTIDQIQKEANDEQLTIQAMNAVPLTTRKEERTTPGPGAGKRGTRNTSDPEGWSTPSSRGRTPFSVQSDKLKNKPPQIDEPLGSSQMFGTWMRGSNIKPQATPMSANMYAALENIGNDIDKRSSMNYSSKDPYHSKGTSLERPNYKHTFEDGRGSRSGSQHRSHDNSQRSKPMPMSQQNLPKNNPPTAPKPRQQPPVEQISLEQSDQLQRKIKNILEEYLNDCYTVTECDEDIRTSLPQSALPQLVSDSYLCVLERSRTARLGSGTLFANLIKRGTLSIDNYCIGLEEVLSQADDLTIDIPKIWDYLAEIIGPIVCGNAVSLIRLHKSFDIIIKQGHASKLLDPLFKLVVAEKGPNYLHSLWQSSGLSFSSFMSSSQANIFIQENQFEFLLGGINTVVSQSELTYEQIHQKLLEFFANDNVLDDIFVWIKANIGEGVKEKQFVRTLATAVFEDSIVKSKLKPDNLRKHYSLLIRIIDGLVDLELECLYALQALINKLEHPQGILLSICGALYDDNIFSHDSFVKWETSDNPAEQEGKGVALKQLTSFFTQLKEADEETSSTEDA